MSLVILPHKSLKVNMQMQQANGILTFSAKVSECKNRDFF